MKKLSNMIQYKEHCQTYYKDLSWFVTDENNISTKIDEKRVGLSRDDCEVLVSFLSDSVEYLICDKFSITNEWINLFEFVVREDEKKTERENELIDKCLINVR